MNQVPKIEPEKLKALNDEVDALDRLPPSLEVLERTVKLVAKRFSVTVLAAYRVSGPTTYLDFSEGSPAKYMSVKLEDDGRYHCFHQYMQDQYDILEAATSTVAWYYLIGRPYPSIGRYNFLQP
jgi:hypothetical protein